MPREITSHKVQGQAVDLSLLVLFEEDYGPNIFYRISTLVGEGRHLRVLEDVTFQRGAVADKGVNGVTNEVLLAILIDRLQGFQQGEFACEENALALTRLEEALSLLKARSESRILRGVEGTQIT